MKLTSAIYRYLRIDGETAGDMVKQIKPLTEQDKIDLTEAFLLEGIEIER